MPDVSPELSQPSKKMTGGCFIFLDISAGQGSGWKTSAASSTTSFWLTFIPLCWWSWKLLWYPKWKRYLDQQVKCLQWSDSVSYVHCTLYPAWVVQKLVAQDVPVPNPSLPPILPKHNPELLMALAFPPCWNVQPLIKGQSLNPSSDFPVVSCFPFSAACISFPFNKLLRQLWYSSSLNWYFLYGIMSDALLKSKQNKSAGKNQLSCQRKILG